MVVVPPSPDALGASGPSRQAASPSDALAALDPASPTGRATALPAGPLHGPGALVGESSPALADPLPPPALAIVSLGPPSTAVALVVEFGSIERVGPVRENFVSWLVPAVAALVG